MLFLVGGFKVQRVQCDIQKDASPGIQSRGLSLKIYRTVGKTPCQVQCTVAELQPLDQSHKAAQLEVKGRIYLQSHRPKSKFLAKEFVH